jgi:PHD/YefM family antitoxin component YafN of YafNO toxin-antitoxin module
MNNNQAKQLNLTNLQDLTKALHSIEKGNPILIHLDGKEIAAIISLEDLRLLERLIEEEEEERIDLSETRKVLREVKEQGTVPWEEIKASIGS